MDLPRSEVYTRSKKFQYWNEILHTWIFQVEQGYRLTNGNDPVYRYKEQTHTSLFAAAAIQSRWIALTECRSMKIRKDQTETNRGKTDLTIWRSSNKRLEIEAKFTRISISSDLDKRVSTTSNKSLSDALRTSPNNSQKATKIALNFIVPIITTKKLQKTDNNKLLEFLKEINSTIKKEIKPDFFSCVYPGKSPVSGRPEYNALGVIVYGRVPSDLSKIEIV